MTSVDEVKEILKQEMTSRNLKDNKRRAGLAAIVGGESGFIPKYELGYTKTSNERIREIFPSRTSNLSDQQLDNIKHNDRTWFNFIYGGEWGKKNLGNIEEDDGYNYRGVGLIQLTGRSNFTRYAELSGLDLVNHPELLITPRASAAVAVEYFKDRFKGGNFEDMKRAVGVSVGGPNEVKNQLYQEYLVSGEFDSPGETETKEEPKEIALTIDPAVDSFLDALQDLERFLKSKKLYSGPIDNDPGPGVREGLRAYLKSVKN